MQKVNRINRRGPLKKIQAGFTLVEIAIVLVIIGLLLGGVLKGTELIEGAKVKRGVNEINGVTSAFYSYQDRYQRLPGDDGPTATITARGGVWATLTGGGNNGVITAPVASTFTAPAGSEHELLWKHLKAAGFINGNPADNTVSALPRNAFGGLIGFTVGPVGDPAAPIGGRIVCLSQVPGKSAAAIDTQIDDGNGNSGKVRAILGAAGVNTAPTLAIFAGSYNETAIYTICVQM